MISVFACDCKHSPDSFAADDSRYACREANSISNDLMAHNKQKNNNIRSLANNTNYGSSFSDNGSDLEDDREVANVSLNGSDTCESECEGYHRNPWQEADGEEDKDRENDEEVYGEDDEEAEEEEEAEDVEEEQQQQQRGMKDQFDRSGGSNNKRKNRQVRKLETDPLSVLPISSHKSSANERNKVSEKKQQQQ